MAVWFCAVLLFLCVILFNRIVMGIKSSSDMFGSEVRMSETLRSNFRCSSMIITYVLIIPFYAVFFSLSGISLLDFWKVLVIVSGYFIFRYVVQSGIKIINGSSDTLDKVEKLGFASFIIIGALYLVILIFMRFFPGMPEIVCRGYCIVVFVLVMSCYLLRERKFFLGSRFSHFFWFLYLCAFEILPICVVVKALVY